MAEIQGECGKRFAAVKDALAESLSNDDVGASVAVYLDGEPVVDLWGGYADADRTIPWERDTSHLPGEERAQGAAGDARLRRTGTGCPPRPPPARARAARPRPRAWATSARSAS